MDLIVKLSLLFILIVSASIGLYLFYCQNQIDKYEAIIVGSGFAGMSAAIELYHLSNGTFKIILVEKEPVFGGNSMYAQSGINLLDTPVQKAKNSTDSYQHFFDDTMLSSKNLSDPKLVKALVEGSRDIYKFLSQFQVELPNLAMLGGHSIARTHRPSGEPVGYTITTALKNYIINQTRITMRLNSSAYEIIATNDTIHGIKYRNTETNETRTLHAPVVILATGGYAHDFSSNSLIQEFVPGMMNFPTSNGPQAEGLGIKMARHLGAGLLHMEHVQIHPTAFVDLKQRYAKRKLLAPELLRGVGGILLNQTGHRFCNELGYRDYVSQKIIENCQNYDGQVEAIIAIPNQAKVEYGNQINSYIKKGFILEYDNWEAFCKHYNLSIENVKATLEKYNQSFHAGIDEFGKTKFPVNADFNEKVWGGIVTPAIHYTMGGLRINTKAQILKGNTDDHFIGLYGAGEVTGGVHGGNRLGANSLLECAVFGRIAAKEAFQFILNLYQSNNSLI